MKHWLPLFVLLFSFSAIAEESLTPLGRKVAAPEFELIDMDGHKHRLSDFKGRPVVINFWTTWCPPCRFEIPSMNRGWAKVKDDGIVFIAINVGEDADTIFQFFADYPVNFLVLLDLSGNIIEQWPVKGLPTTYVVDPDGKFAYRAIGSREWDDDKLLDMVRSLKK